MNEVTTNLNNDYVEKVVIKSALSDPLHLKEICKIPPEFFDNHCASLILEKIQSHYEQHKVAPLPEIIINSAPVDDRESVENYLNEIESIGSNIDGIRSDFDKWSNLQNCKRFVKDVVDIIDTKQDISEIWDRVETAKNFTIYETEELDEIDQSRFDLIKFDESLMIGPAKDFALEYSSRSPYLPIPYLYFGFLTCLGSVISDKVVLHEMIDIQPRFYTLFIGKSGISKKSTTIKRILEVFENDSLQDEFYATRGFGSGEAILKLLSQKNKLLWRIDELLGLVKKNQQSGSTLLNRLSTLFDNNDDDNNVVDEKKSYVIRDGFLSMLGACTPETYEEIMNSSHDNIGFDKRLFIVTSNNESLYKLSPVDYDDLVLKYSDIVIDLYEWVKDMTPDNSIRGRKAISLSETAIDHYFEWEKEILTMDVKIQNRLNTYTLRLALLLAASTKQHIITSDLMDVAIKTMQWQKHVREEFRIEDCGNGVALFESKIKNQLKKGVMTEKWLKNRLEHHINKHGIYFYEKALTNLERAGYTRSLGTGKIKKIELVKD